MPFIHHSTEQMDWLASSRLHIVEVLMTRFIATLPIFLLGFHTLRSLLIWSLFLSMPFLFTPTCVSLSLSALADRNT
jgi:sterol desaturase/sphingolipid hydroxylase (fatty acid hydroxylase superfamily)